MTDRKPPQGPPPIPPLGSYHPSDEHTGEPGWDESHLGRHARHGRQPAAPAPHDLERELPFAPHPHAPHSHTAPPQPHPGQSPNYAPWPPAQPYGEPPYGTVPYGPGGQQQPYVPAQHQQYTSAQHPEPAGHAPHPYPTGAHRAGPPGRQPPPPMRPGGPPPMHPPLRHPASPAGGGGRSVVRLLLLVMLALVVIAGAGGAYLLYALPPDFVRDQITSQVKAKTGRDLVIAGSTSFTLYPSIGISMSDVTLSPPPGMTGKPLVTMQGLEAAVEVLPLLKREIRVERLVLTKPVFELYTDAKGRKSWEFALSGASRPVRLAQAAAPASDAPGGLPTDASPPAVVPAGAAVPQASLDQLALGDVRIVDGTLNYANAASGGAQRLDHVNVAIGLVALNQPLSAKGDLVWKSEKIAFDGEMTSLKAVMDDKPAKVAANLASAPVDAHFDGSVILRDGVETDGAVNAKSPSLRKLMGWLGTELPPAKGFGALEAKGQLRTTPAVITLSNANLSLDGATATGQLSIDTSGARPYVKTTLQLSELDLNKYMRPAGSPAPAKRARAPAKAAVPATAPATAGEKPSTIEDLLRDSDSKAGPKVQGYVERAGWSSEAIDFDGLGLADADAKLTVGKLFFQDLKVGRSQLTVALKNSVMKTTFDDIQLYGGHGRGFVSIDASADKAATIGTNMTVEGLDARPFLEDAAGFDRLSGKAKLSLAVAGQGASQLQLVETLNGKADLVFTEGAIAGINVAGMVRGLNQGKLGGLSTSPSEKTDFSELGSTWTITNGVASNQDLHLMSPLLRLTGAGTVSLPQRHVDYLMRPKLVSSLSGQGGKDEGGIEIPVKVQGPWDKLAYTPDLSGILKDPNKALDQVKKIGEQLKGKDAGAIVKGILGGNKGAAAEGGANAGGGTTSGQQKLDAKSILDGLLKKQ